jgi:hypothetical protein
MTRMSRNRCDKRMWPSMGARSASAGCPLTGPDVPVVGQKRRAVRLYHRDGSKRRGLRHASSDSRHSAHRQISSSRADHHLAASPVLTPNASANAASFSSDDATGESVAYALRSAWNPNRWARNAVKEAACA